jgi:hypothetical protein
MNLEPVFKFPAPRFFGNFGSFFCKISRSIRGLKNCEAILPRMGMSAERESQENTSSKFCKKVAQNFRKSVALGI